MGQRPQSGWKVAERQIAETKPKDALLFAEPCAISNLKIVGFESRIERLDSHVRESIAAEAHAAKRTRIRTDPFHKMRMIARPLTEEIKSLRKAASTIGEDGFQLVEQDFS